MSYRRISCVFLGLVFVAVSGSSSAKAGGPAFGYGGYYPFYAQYGREYIPYFALHPPVYYSYPVPRTYGYSPFAYPFGSLTPEFEQRDAPRLKPKAKPKVTYNPHFRQGSPVGHSTQTNPPVIYNPYVIDARIARDDRP